jgi:hypothetical protein
MSSEWMNKQVKIIGGNDWVWEVEHVYRDGTALLRGITAPKTAPRKYSGKRVPLSKLRKI